MKKIIKKLDIGCGPNKLPGYIGVDIQKTSGVDLVLDLDRKKLPYKAGSINTIYSSHFLEHVIDPIKILQEFNRVLSSSGEIVIIVPHYKNPYSYHFTHKTYWSSYAFKQEYLDYYVTPELHCTEVRLRFLYSRAIDPVLNWFFNLHDFTRSLYERLFSSVLHAWEIKFVLKKRVGRKTKDMPWKIRSKSQR